MYARNLICLSFLMAVLSAGCGHSPQTVLGATPTGGTVLTVQQIAPISDARSVMLQGEMVEKCPVAGCWFKLRDKTGVVRVDTKAAGFVVSDVPLHANLTVQGRVVAGTEAGIAATGIRY